MAVQLFDLTVSDIGELAMALVDAATLVVGTPIVLGATARPRAFSPAAATSKSS